MIDQTCQPLGILQQEVRSLVLGETPGQAEREDVRVENLRDRVHPLPGFAALPQLPGEPFTGMRNQFASLFGGQLPERLVVGRGDIGMQRVHRTEPALLAACARP